MNSGPILFAALIWLAVMILFMAVWRFAPQRDPVEARLRDYGFQPGVDLEAAGDAPARRRLPLMQRMVNGFGLGPALALGLMRADLAFTAAEFALIVLVAGGLGFALGALRSSVLLGVLLGFAGAAAPLVYLRYRQGRRLRQLTQQIPDVMTLLVGALRAGYGLNQALEALVHQMPAPSSVEFGRAVKAVSLGVPVTRALQDMARRVGSDDLSLIVTAIVVQYEMGGNLAGVLETISDTVRERIRILREVRVLTAQQRLTGYILAGFPAFLAFGIWLSQPDYFAPFFQPGPLQLLPLMVLVSMIIGFFVIRRIVDIKV